MLDLTNVYEPHKQYLEGSDFSYSRTKAVYGPQEDNGMYMNDYQHRAVATAQYDDPMYPICSVMVEAAELADIFIKPWLRGDMEDPDRAEVISEAGDVLWNLANLLKDMEITLEEVAQYNLNKIDDRVARGVIQGNGGNR